MDDDDDVDDTWGSMARDVIATLAGWASVIQLAYRVDCRRDGKLASG